MLGVEGQRRKSARRSSALVSPRYRSKTRAPAMTLARPETRFDRCPGSTFRLPNIRHTTDKDRRASHRRVPLLVCGRLWQILQDCKIDWARKIHRCRSRSLTVALHCSMVRKPPIGGGETTIGGCVKHRHQQHERRHQLGYTASATKVRQMLAPISLSKARFPQLVM